MSEDEFQARLQEIRAIADKLRELEQEAATRRASLSTRTNPRLDAAYAMLARELREVADAADVITEHPELVAAREAVDSIPPIDQRVNEGFISLVYDKGEMLAAIDELRKKP